MPEEIVIPKADLKEYGFQCTTNQKSEMIWLRPLVVLDAKAAENITHDQVLEILEVKAINVLQRVVQQRQTLRDMLIKAEIDKDKGRLLQ